MNATNDQTRQQAQDLLVHVEELLADVSDPDTTREAVVRLTSVVALLNGTEEREKQRTPKRRRRLNERRLETKLVNLFDTLFSRRSGGWAESFEDAGVLTGNRGVVISVGTGQEFQLTIVESKRR